MRLLLFVLSVLVSTAAIACPAHQVMRPENVHIDADAILIVVHGSSTFDARFSSKRGLDEATRFAKGKGIPIVYLEDDSPQQFYFMDDCEPTYWIFSQGGEIRFDISKPTKIYIAGGHLELCMAEALNDILLQWARSEPRNRRVVYFMDAIYSNGKMMGPSDPFYRDFDRFMEVVAYGRPGGEHWPKLTLLETMGIILDDGHKMDYLLQVLPRWDTTFPDHYQVEMTWGDYQKRVLHSGGDWRSPRIEFEFVDSALDLQFPNCEPGSFHGECSRQ
jgi:hypothetical protein